MVTVGVDGARRWKLLVSTPSTPSFHWKTHDQSRPGRLKIEKEGKIAILASFRPKIAFSSAFSTFESSLDLPSPHIPAQRAPTARASS